MTNARGQATRGAREVGLEELERRNVAWTKERREAREDEMKMDGRGRRGERECSPLMILQKRQEARLVMSETRC